MPIFRIKDQNVLFIHIPKTGGTSIEKWLGRFGSPSLYNPKLGGDMPCVPQHFHKDIYEYMFSPDFFDYKFCVVRNPYNRMISAFNYRMKTRRLYKYSPFNLHQWCRLEFLRYRTSSYILGNHLRPQSEYIYGDPEIFYFEEGLGKVKAKIEAMVGTEIEDDMKVYKKSVPTATGMSDSTADLIYNFYKSDFDMFGYDRDSYQALGQPK
ncbi:sulfotransferase family 2 domain-containing protein [Afifella sp. IM 167]|uniref:sulfotransferase family 2 domain-containing protein n=1 Tax=Afifella sp. IM 167 TaxID=2033586 RepID=UPI001CCF1C2E|nr:sulfotransferase family 2 domain-containing protein [Afifella sp. IM 167]MBZ8133731.1 hypothetical protein [Afifella sp. IM 167]